MTFRPCRVELCPHEERRPHGFCDAHLTQRLRARCAAYGCVTWILPTGGRTRCFRHSGPLAERRKEKSKVEVRSQTRRVHASYACSGEAGYGPSVLSSPSSAFSEPKKQTGKTGG